MLHRPFIFEDTTSKTTPQTIWTSEDGLVLKTFTGEQARPYIEHIAHLRITMFKEFPYLYEGSFDGEKKHLETYCSSPKYLVLLLLKDTHVVGFFNAIPLAENGPDSLSEIQAPFIAQGIDMAPYLYVGEVMVLKEFRRPHLIQFLYAYGEALARELGKDYLIFAMVKRPREHLARPADYQSLELLCAYFGFAIMKGMEIHASWKQIDTQKKEPNTLAIWCKKVTQE
ncbi:MAG: hypothetical protein QG604_811 [Candidatus Dependentiae bacterium]|nr:hypothetical protein [Candidatus Dependentiae bacterium]